MSFSIMIDDQSSRLKQFTWEELEGNLCLAVLFRADRRYIHQRYFERELSQIKCLKIANQWRHCLFHCKSTRSRLTSAEIQLMRDILSWHCDTSLKIYEQIDCLIDFEDLLDAYHSLTLPDDEQSTYLIQPVTTLDAARRNIELWTKHSIDPPINPILENPLSFFTAQTGWIQLDSKIIPFIKKHSDRLLPVEYLLKEHLITSSEDFSLRSLYIPSNINDLQIFRNLLAQSNWILPNQASFITLDHLIFRLKRLFFIRFLSSHDPIDYSRIMSCDGGLLTSSHQRLPFLYINNQKYIPQIHSSSNSTYPIINPHQFEYLRLITLYDYLSSEDNQEYLRILFTRTTIQLIRVDSNDYTSISLIDFHRHEYQRRTQQEQSPWIFSDDDPPSNGWWQSPKSSKTKRSKSSHWKYQRTVLF